jgi:tRNA(Arg) A34 adenosine deaminase TadA
MVKAAFEVAQEGLAVNLEPCVMCLGAAMTGGILRRECRELFRQYCQTAPESGLRSWAQTIADLPD